MPTTSKLKETFTQKKFNKKRETRKLVKMEERAKVIGKQEEKLKVFNLEYSVALKKKVGKIAKKKLLLKQLLTVMVIFARKFVELNQLSALYIKYLQQCKALILYVIFNFFK